MGVGPVMYGLHIAIPNEKVMDDLKGTMKSESNTACCSYVSTFQKSDSEQEFECK